MSWLSRKKTTPIKVDIHSHLIPGIDDGSQSINESMELLSIFHKLGFEKVITTPHIHPKYPNTKDRIEEGFRKVQSAIQEADFEIELEVAAEYYVDDIFLDRLNNDEPLLSFGDRYILIECSFINKPMYFESAIFEIQSKGYQPVFAHPERYKFLEGSIDWLKELKETGILFQVTLGSLSGYYGELPKKIGLKLLKSGMVDFLASDLHRMGHVEKLKAGIEHYEVQKVLESGGLLNDSLL